MPSGVIKVYDDLGISVGWVKPKFYISTDCAAVLCYSLLELTLSLLNEQWLVQLVEMLDLNISFADIYLSRQKEDTCDNLLLDDK